MRMTPPVQTEPNISGVRVDVDLIAQTLEQWGGWNQVHPHFSRRDYLTHITKRWKNNGNGLPSEQTSLDYQL